eukprot:9183014-Lingulodinium_polyedra.AAC.1
MKRASRTWTPTRRLRARAACGSRCKLRTRSPPTPSRRAPWRAPRTTAVRISTAVGDYCTPRRGLYA